jgi:hypothetical protein
MSLRTKRLTEEQMAQEVAEAEKAGDTFALPDMTAVRSQHAVIGDPANRPTNVREAANHRERRAFAEQFNEPTSAYEAKAARMVREAEAGSQLWTKWFTDLMRANKSLQSAWDDLGGQGIVPLLLHMRFRDARNVPQDDAITAQKTFADFRSPDPKVRDFSAYREIDKASPRFAVQMEVMDKIFEFMKTNALDFGLADTWLASFQWLANSGLLPAPMAMPEEVPLTAAERHVIARQNYIELIIGNDEHGVNYTEEMLDKLPAKEALRLRRLFEKGHRGSILMDQYFEVRDAQAERDRKNAIEFGR